MKTSNQLIHGLWIGNELSPIEQLCIQSFLKNGHTFYLWCYNEVLNVPDQTILKDANKIIKSESVFSYKSANQFGHGKGSYAGFSDLFRYKLLYEYGGIWVDMDITCLKPFDFEMEYVFRYHHKASAVGNIMKCPKNAPIMKWCYDQTLVQVNAQNKNWMLPIEILNQGIEKFSLKDNILKISNNDSWPEVAKMLRKKINIPYHWYAIHWMNEEFRRLKFSKNLILKNTTINVLVEKYNIKIQHPIKFNKFIHYFKCTRLYYLLINLRYIIYDLK